MKIKIKDTFTKANAVNYILMFLCIAAAVAFALMGPMVSQWFAAGFALLAGFTFCRVIGLKTQLNLTEQVHEQTEQVDVIANLDQQYNKDVEDLSEQLAEALKQKTELEGQLQARDNEYLKLAKAHNDMARQLSELKEKNSQLQEQYENMANDKANSVFVSEFASEKPTTPPKPKKNPVTSGKKKKTVAQIKEELVKDQQSEKKGKYSKNDINRIKAELRSVGMTTIDDKK